jgi:hypothetical protein
MRDPLPDAKNSGCGFMLARSPVDTPAPSDRLARCQAASDRGQDVITATPPHSAPADIRPERPQTLSSTEPAIS